MVKIECGYPNTCMYCNKKSDKATIVYRYNDDIKLRLCINCAKKMISITSDIIKNIET